MPRHAAALIAALVVVGLAPISPTPTGSAHPLYPRAVPPVVDAASGLRVGVPPGPVPVDAGRTTVLQLTVANPGPLPRTVRLSVRPSVGPYGPVAAVAPDLTIGAGDDVAVPVTVAVPDTARPDLYRLDLLVQPDDRPAGVPATITLDVPGYREHHLTVDLPRLPRVQVGTALRGRITIRNAGVTTALTRADVRVDGEHIALGEELLPAGAGRDLRYRWHTGRWVSVVQPSALVTYGDGAGALGGYDTAGRPVVLIAPQVLGLAAALLLVGLLAAGRLVRRRRAPARP